MRTATRGNEPTPDAADEEIDRALEALGDENERPTLPGVRMCEPWPERTVGTPQSLRTRTSRWRAVAATAIEGGAARVSLVDGEEAAAAASSEDTTRESGARQVSSEATSPAPPVGRKPARATVRMMIPGLRGPTGTRRMWAPSPAPEGADATEGPAREPRLVVSGRWLAVAIVVGVLCVVAVAVALRVASHRARLAVPATTAHVP